MPARISAPEGGTSFFDYQPELYAKFNKFYGEIWTNGALDQASKEVGRLRNARITDCGLWKGVRFAGAKQQGLTEDLVDLIGEGYEASDLPERYKAIVALADVIISDPSSGVPQELEAQLKEEFSPEELAELVLMISVAVGFSKSAIAWGPPPDMPITELPSPVPL